MARILVTDGEQRAALAVVRSLGRAGHEVSVCSARRRSLAGASRYARSQLAVPDPLSDPDAFVEAVGAACESQGIEVLLPIGEAALLAVLPRSESFGPVRIPFPDAARFERVCDKARVAAAAQAQGIATPRQIVLDEPDALGKTGRNVRFPLVIKPSRSVIAAGGGRAKTTVGYAADAASLETAIARLPREAFPLLLQQRIEGPGVGVFLLLWDGRVVARFAHRRIREKPPAGGVSVLRESTLVDDALLQRSIRLLEGFDWQGVAMVEYKLSRDGEPYLMEINGRFWGSLQLAVDAGVDFPALLVAAALGQAPTEPGRYRTGVRLRWALGDVDHILARLRRTNAELALPPDAPGRSRAIWEFLKSCAPTTRGEILRWHDPWPAAREAVDWLRGR